MPKFEHIRLVNGVIGPDRNMTKDLNARDEKPGHIAITLEEYRNGVLATWGRFRRLIPWGNIKVAAYLQDAEVQPDGDADSAGKNPPARRK